MLGCRRRILGVDPGKIAVDVDEDFASDSNDGTGFLEAIGLLMKNLPPEATLGECGVLRSKLCNG